MQTLELGYLNAGFIFFGLLILSTLILGRFFCGWACHLVAYQDLCSWILHKVGVKPKPFRSRLLVFVPLFAAFYMFAWPQVLRLWAGHPFPAIAYHLATERFWQTFPGPGIAALTFGICGFLAVYLLGNKGFCTYGCPYGAIFYHADRVAQGKIRVTDACDGCGHCTASCTSNVRVHEEVKLYKMVVDAGCMKCLDCIDVCPKQALYFGFGAPSLATDQAVRKLAHSQISKKAYDFTIPQELAMASAFLVSFYAFRGLYNSVPFLLAIGLGSIAAFLFGTGISLISSPAVRIARYQLKSAGKLSSKGYAYAVLLLGLSGFIIHSIFIEARAHQAYAAYADRQISDKLANAQAAADGFAWADSHGLVRVPDWEAKAGTAYLEAGDRLAGKKWLALATEIAPDNLAIRKSLALVFKEDKNWAGEEIQLRKVLQLDPKDLNALADLADCLVASDRQGEAVEVYRRLLVAQPMNPNYRMNRGLILARLGRLDEAITDTKLAARINPKDAMAPYNLGLILAQKGQWLPANAAFREALVRNPALMPAKLEVIRLELRQGKAAIAWQLAQEARAESPMEPECLALWARCAQASGALPDELKHCASFPSRDIEHWYAAAFLYRQSDDVRTSSAIMRRIRDVRPDLTNP